MSYTIYHDMICKLSVLQCALQGVLQSVAMLSSLYRVVYRCHTGGVASSSSKRGAARIRKYIYTHIYICTRTNI